MKRNRNKVRAAALLMALCLVLSLCGCGPAGPANTANTANGVPAENVTAAQNAAPVQVPENLARPGDAPAEGKQEYDSGSGFDLDIPEGAGGIVFGGPVQGAAGVGDRQIQGANGSSAPSAQMPAQLTIEDIQAMNPGTTVVDIYRNNGYLSTLVGKYYDKPVANAEDGVESIKGLASLLGLGKGCEFFVVYSEKDDDGYTYYTYQQRYGGLTLQYATLRIVVDPSGYTAGLTCSFVPNAGIAPEENVISSAEAVNAVKRAYPNLNLTYFEEHTVRLAATFNNIVYNCWVVYTNNPDASAAFDMPYVEHYIRSSDGSYLIAVPANTFSSSNMDYMNTDGYFEGLDTQMVSKSIKLASGAVRNVTVPVSRNSKDGKYYLIDPSRKMAVAQYRDFYYNGIVNPVSSTTQDGFSDNNLLAYDNYIKAYDFYASRGVRSIDGFGIPVLVTVGYCDENGNPVDNACFYGVNQGWACFAVSDANRYSDCLDVVAHEFTHGVTRQSMQGTAYRNEQGSINESYSDIMGNICEMISGDTADKDWLIAENSGKVMRSMKDPNKYSQPEYVGDVYYVPPVLYPEFNVNDYGGVHGDNSLVGHMAYLLDRAGMTLAEQFSMWCTSIELLTPLSDYEDLHGILLFSLKINGMLQKYGPTLNKAFADAGLNDLWDISYLEATKPGHGRVKIQTDAYYAGGACVVLFANQQGQVVSTGFPDRNGIISALLPAGTYIAQMQFVENNQTTTMNYDGSGWSAGQQFGTYNITNGGVTTLPVLNSGKSPNQGGGSGGTTELPPGKPQGEKLNLVEFNGGYFTMLVPEGWRIEVSGEYACFAVKLFDPMTPGLEVFTFGALAPFHKSEQTRRVLAMYDNSGMIANGPVLTDVSVRGITDNWQNIIDYQKRYDGKQLFTSFTNINMVDARYYSGPYANNRNAVETVGASTCYASDGTQCIFLLASALVDTDYNNVMGGNWYYTAYDTVGVSAPFKQFDGVYKDLLTCIGSLQFSEDYIARSQYTNLPLASNQDTAAGMAQITSIIDEMYKLVK